MFPHRVVFAAVIGRHTRIYPKKYRNDASTTIIIKRYHNLKDLQQNFIDLAPELTYCNLNLYRDDDGHVRVGQELAFDLDPENIICPVHGSLDEKIRRHQGLPSVN
jgi:hypothetical protein